MIREVQNAAFVDGSAPTQPHDSLLPLLYAGDQSYGWSEGMRAVTHALLEGITLPDGPVIEVGCGGGQMLAELRHLYPHRQVVGSDVHPLALAQTRCHLQSSSELTHITLTQAALPNLPWQDNHVALLVALDVFDQQEVELDAALAEAYRLLRPDGALVMRVSAHPSLYGAHDLAFHTGQRYTRTHLEDALLHAGFAVQRLTYANATLSLPVAALRLAQRWGVLPWQPEVYRQDHFHRISAWILRQEAAWLRHAELPWGLSLCAVARKP